MQLISATRVRDECAYKKLGYGFLVLSARACAIGADSRKCRLGPPPEKSAKTKTFV